MPGSGQTWLAPALPSWPQARRGLQALRGAAPSPRRALLAPHLFSHLTARLRFRADALETEEGLGMEEPLAANTGTEALQPGRRGSALGGLT